jgi:hypothetical protein
VCQARRRRLIASPTKPRPIRPTMPGSGTVVPPELDDVVELVVVPPDEEVVVPPEDDEVVVPPEDEEVVVPPDDDEVVVPPEDDDVLPPDEEDDDDDELDDEHIFAPIASPQPQ